GQEARAKGESCRQDRHGDRDLRPPAPVARESSGAHMNEASARNPFPDVVIVGGGSAGALLASRLSEEPARRVLLIEAGEEPADPDIWNPAAWPALQGRSYDRDYRTEPQPGTAGRIHHWARGKMVGGSSCLHAMGYMRG